MGTSSSNVETEVMPLKESGNLASRSLRNYKQLKEKDMSESQLAFKRLRASRPVSFYQSDESPVMLQDFSKPGVLEALEESISKRNVGRSYENWLPQQKRGCLIHSLDEHGSTECLYVAEVPKNAIVGKAADLRCKFCIFCRKHGEHWTEQCPRRYQ